MFWPVLMDQLRGKDFSPQRPCPLGPRNCVQSSAQAPAVNCHWQRKYPSKINLIRMNVINHHQTMALAVNPAIARAEKQIEQPICAASIMDGPNLPSSSPVLTLVLIIVMAAMLITSTKWLMVDIPDESKQMSAEAQKMVGRWEQ